MVGLCILAGIFCILQVSILRGVAIAQVTPDIVLAIVVYTGLFHEKVGIWFGFASGTFIDLYSSSFGYNALIYTIIGYGIGVLSSKIYKEIPFLWIILLFGCGLVHDVVIFAVEQGLSSYSLGRYIIPGVLYTTIVGVGMFYILRRSRV